MTLISIVDNGLLGAWPALLPVVVFLLPAIHSPTRGTMKRWMMS